MFTAALETCTLSGISERRITFFDAGAMSALPPKADMCSAQADVRFVPIADIALYSITSSASSCIECVRFSDLLVSTYVLFCSFGAKKPQTTSKMMAPTTAPIKPAPSPARYQPRACPR